VLLLAVMGALRPGDRVRLRGIGEDGAGQDIRVVVDLTSASCSVNEEEPWRALVGGFTTGVACRRHNVDPAP
jgi:hypothetical protein